MQIQYFIENFHERRMKTKSIRFDKNRCAEESTITPLKMFLTTY